MKQKGDKVKGLIFVVSGPSGSGKTTLVDRVVKGAYLKNKLARSISATTRRKRSSETEGKDYFFLSTREFQQRNRARQFLEQTKYLGYHYATPKDFVETQISRHKHIILCLDLKGAAAVKRFYPKNTVTIFILPPSLAVLRERIERRCNKTKKKEIRQRLKLARREFEACRRYDHCLINKNLQQAARELRRIILRKINK